MQVTDQPGRVPRHIAIIMDGNGRWAEERHRPRLFGHKAGVDSVREVVEAAVHAKDKQIEGLEEELGKLRSRLESSPGGSDPGKVAELEAELANANRKLTRLEQTITRLRGMKG